MGVEATGRSTIAGRQAELEALQGVLDHVALGEPQVVEIYGEAGIGKTRLLDELARQARLRGATVVCGRAGEYQRDVRFGIVAETLNGLGRLRGAERHHLHRCVRRVLTQHARPPGLAILLDDLHWADDASLELLEQMLLDLPPASLLLAVAYHGQHVPPGLPSALARTRADVTRLAPGPLTESDVAQLLPGIPDRRRRLLLDLSGGNPLYLGALAGVDEPTLLALADPGKAAPEDMPSRLRALLTTELRWLNATERLVAHATAIAGDPAELDLVVSVADRAEEEVFRALDTLVALGVLYTAGPSFKFRHPLVRAAVYQSAGPAWRISAHQRAERHLRARGGSLPLRAHHLSRAARHGGSDEDVSAILARAATTVLQTSPTNAAAWLDAALRLVPESDDARRVDLLLPLAQALNMSGRLAESRQALHEVLRLGPRRREAVGYCAVADRLLGRLDESRAMLEAELTGTSEPDGRGALVIELAATAVLLGDTAECTRHAREAVTAGTRRDDRSLVAAGTTLLGLAALQEADVRSAREFLAEAVRLTDGLPDASLCVNLSTLSPLAWLELHLEHYADGQRHVQRGIELARSSGRTNALPYLFIVGAAIAERMGRLDLARSLAEDAREVSATIGSAETMAMTAAVELRGALWQRGPDAALVLGGKGKPRSRWWAEETDVAMATVLLFAGHPAGVVAHAAAYLDETRTDSGGFTAAQWHAWLALARSALGAWDEALDLSERALQLADSLDLPYQRGIAHLAHARVLADCGQLPLSVDEAEVAATWFSRAQAPLYTALAHDLAAETLAAAGDLQRARVEFGRAKSGYSACAAGWLQARTRNSESRLGARAPRPRRPDAAGTVEALSSREREIARLVADGLTNREIAAKLFLSAKTVEAHLARVFTKLGVKSRVGVAQRLTAGAPH